MNTETFQDIQEFLPPALSLEICICIIQELVDQLLILKTIGNWPEVSIENFCYQSLMKRFDETLVQDKDFVDVIPKQCGFMVSLFENLLEEMKNEGTFVQFSNTINILLQMKLDEENLTKAVKDKENEVEGLQAALNNEKNEYVNKILKCMTNIGKLKDKIDNFKVESEIKKSYIKSWQNSKFEMDKASFTETLHKISEKISTTKSKLNIEIRVHNDFERAMSEFQQEFEEQIEDWKIKYSETLEIMMQKIDALQKKQNNQLEVISNHKTMYENRQREIHDWDVYKIEQEKIRLEKEKKHKASTVIQAWWRGTMVRKGFGKYRKKKDKKPKKSSEKSTKK